MTAKTRIGAHTLVHIVLYGPTNSVQLLDF